MASVHSTDYLYAYYEVALCLDDVDKKVKTDEVPAENKQINIITDYDSSREGNRKGMREFM